MYSFFAIYLRNSLWLTDVGLAISLPKGHDIKNKTKQIID